MNEEELKETIKNLLMMQTNNDYNFQLLEAKIDRLEKRIKDLDELREVFRLPPPQNLDREPFEFVKD